MATWLRLRWVASGVPGFSIRKYRAGAFERGEMNLTLASLLLLAQTFKVKVVDLFRGLED